jgi:hypothetical protein
VQKSTELKSGSRFSTTTAATPCHTPTVVPDSGLVSWLNIAITRFDLDRKVELILGERKGLFASIILFKA